ncbi:MAG: EamA family transporter [Synergistaceae bacterium]|nr:EamA family transporter [Synergistaceae bacterium]
MSAGCGAAAERPARWLIIVAYLLLYVVWGSTYLAIRFSVETIPPLLSGGLRFLAAGAILLTVRLSLTKSLPTASGWKMAFRASLLPFAVTYGLITTAEMVVPSSIAALLVSIEPLWFCLIGWLFFNGKKPLPRHYAGIAFGFAGVCVLVAGDPNAELSFSSGYTLWMLLLLLASLTWVTGAFIAANPNIHSDALTASGMQMLCGGAVMMALQYGLSCVTGEFPEFQAFSARSALALGYLVIFGSLVGYSSFLWLMRVEPANRVSTHAFVNPVVAVLLGWLIGGEQLHVNMLIALPLVVISVILMVWEGAGKKKG